MASYVHSRRRSATKAQAGQPRAAKELPCNLCLDVDLDCVWREDDPTKVVRLRPILGRLVEAFLQAPQFILSRQGAYAALYWDRSPSDMPPIITVTAHICHLRAAVRPLRVRIVAIMYEGYALKVGPRIARSDPVQEQ